MSSRANGYTPSYRGGDKSPYSRPDRPQSEQLVDLHVYVVPPDIWRSKYNNLLNQHVTETISAGIIRVHPEQQVNVLRDEIDQQIGTDQIPREYVFLKSVGRSITKLKPKQEYVLKVKHFVPPQAYAPELYLLEGGIDSFGGSSQGSTRPHSRTPELYNSISNSLNPNQKQNRSPKNLEVYPEDGYPSPAYRNTPIPTIRTRAATVDSKDGVIPQSSSQEEVPNNNKRQSRSPSPTKGKTSSDTSSPSKQRRQSHDSSRSKQESHSNEAELFKDSPAEQQHVQAKDEGAMQSAFQSRTTTPQHVISKPPSQSSKTEHGKPPSESSRHSKPPTPGSKPATPGSKHEGTPGPPPPSVKTGTQSKRGSIASGPPSKRGSISSKPPSNQDQKSPVRTPSSKHESNPPSKTSSKRGSIPLQEVQSNANKSPAPGSVGSKAGSPSKNTPSKKGTPVTSASRSRQNKPDPSKYDTLGERFTTNTNEDSGIAGLTPEETYRENNYDDINYRRKQEEERRRQQEEDERRRREEEDRRRREEEDRRRREEEDRRHQDEEARKRRDEEDERKRQEEELKRRLQDEEEKERQRREKEELEKLDFEKKRQEEEKRRREEEERRRREEEERKKLEEERERRLKQKLGASENDENRFPSPPALKMTELTEAQRQRNFFEREKLFRELELAKEERKLVERQREELVRKAKQMQNKTQNRRNHARDLWKKRYFEEKKKTNPLEEQCNRLRHELDIIHRKLMNTLEGPKEKQTKVGDLKPSKQSNYKIQVTRMTHEIEELRTRLENSKMKLTAELKLRTQAETELRALRAELMQKKIHLSLQRNQQPTAFSSPAPPQSDMLTYRQPMITPRS